MESNSHSPLHFILHELGIYAIFYFSRFNNHIL